VGAENWCPEWQDCAFLPFVLFPSSSLIQGVLLYNHGGKPMPPDENREQRTGQ